VTYTDYAECRQCGESSAEVNVRTGAFRRLTMWCYNCGWSLYDGPVMDADGNVVRDKDGEVIRTTYTREGGAAMGTARKRAVFQLLSESKRITWTTFSLGC
jgi:hypothetical protein